jgi:hypothetical protein
VFVQEPDVLCVCAGSYAFVNYTSHAKANQAIAAMNGQVIGNEDLKCAWLRHQPHQNHGPALGMLQVQSQPGILGLHARVFFPGHSPGHSPATDASSSHSSDGFQQHDMYEGMCGAP